MSNVHRSPFTVYRRSLLSVVSQRLTVNLLLLAFGPTLSAPLTGVFYAQAGQNAEVRLELRLPANFALQKRSEFWLGNPFQKGKRLEARATGRDWSNDPQHYLQSFGPLLWKLQIPATARGEYPLRFKATVYACDESLGLCQKHQLDAIGSLVVGQKGESQPVRLEVPATPKF